LREDSAFFRAAGLSFSTIFPSRLCGNKVIRLCAAIKGG